MITARELHEKLGKLTPGQAIEVKQLTEAQKLFVNGMLAMYSVKVPAVFHIQDNHSSIGVKRLA